MLRFRLVRFAPVVTAAMVAGLVIASAAPALAQGKPPQGAATPQAALDTFEAAIKKGDVPALMDVITPSGRKEFVKDLLVQSLMFLAMADPADPMMPPDPKEPPAAAAKRKAAYAEARTALIAAWKPSGVDTAIGKTLPQATPIIDAGVEKADLVDVASKTYTAMAKAMPAFRPTPGPLPLPIKYGPFSALKVDGATATVKSGPKTLKFEQADGKWLLNFPLPEPKEPPQ